MDTEDRTRKTRPTGLKTIGMTIIALLVTACGGDDGTITLEGATGDTIIVSDERESDPETEVALADPESDEAPLAPSSPGNGSLFADICVDGEPIKGAVTVDDLVSWGIFSTTDVSMSDGPGVSGASAYNDFGVLCNIETADGAEFLTISMSPASNAFEKVVEDHPDTVVQSGTWQYGFGGSLNSLAMQHVDEAGHVDVLSFWWTGDFDMFEVEDEVIEAAMRPLAEAIVTRTTVDTPKLEAPNTPDWFACTDTDAGVVGLDPAAVLATTSDDTTFSVDQEIVSFLDATECTVRAGSDFLSISVQVQASGAVLQDSLDTYLVNWPEATASTIAGRDVAVRADVSWGTAHVFTVIDGVPTEVIVNAEAETDYTDNVVAVAELMLSNIN